MAPMAIARASEPEHGPLLGRTRVPDPVDPHRGAHDGGRERVAREQADECRGPEDAVAEQPRVEERVRRPARVHDGSQRSRPGTRRPATSDTGSAARRLRLAEGRETHQAAREGRRDQARAQDIERAGVPGVDPSRRAPPSTRRARRSPPAHPGRTPSARRAPTGSIATESPRPARQESRAQVEVLQDRGAQERAHGHAQEVGGTHRPQGTCLGGAAEQEAGAGRGERQDRTAAEALDDPRRHELLQRPGGPGQQRAEREDGQRTQQQRRQAVTVGGAAGEGHRRDECQQVAVDHPAGLAAAGSSRTGRPRCAAVPRPWPSARHPPAPTR